MHNLLIKVTVCGNSELLLALATKSCATRNAWTSQRQFFFVTLARKNPDIPSLMRLKELALKKS
ncbi:hypothetical protein JQC92_04910 [Shewanella sp. 202IG2-18]|uniref:hypothetical protein n=1 Tax=Parashewanella hymeniacidonis TaxID=2807618 RepID=UPI001961F26E|nr:hypothetical protein [Parashewanella hymeniacidonis]MBM7071382.1 hypothetical protein [Parashewanella hymeniacidonis]